MGIMEAERDKYAELWTDVPEYRNFSPGLENVQRFFDVLSPQRDYSLIDIGCGEGVAGLAFQDRGLKVTWLDITDAGLKPEVPRQRFIRSALWDRWKLLNQMGFDYGFCCDVMEHIPTEYTMLALDRIISACRMSWFQIAFLHDGHGKFIGKPLHLTVQPFVWWLDRLKGIGNVIDARDLCGRGLFIVEAK
jgi:hypothetical protein